MNVYKIVTEQILEKLNNGVIPWRKTWANGLPASLGSGNEYRGINIVLLGLKDHTSRFWVTYKEAMRLKGCVRKGAKGSQIVFWKWRTEEEKELLKQNGKSHNPAPCIPFFFTVFNLEQTEGLTAPADDLKCERKEKIDSAEKVVESFCAKPAIGHGQFFKPSYCPPLDSIQMPHLSQFRSSNHYYSTLFHELVHSTGHSSRLDRDLKGFSAQESYSFEELVAELGAAFLCAHAGIDNEKTIEDQSSYINHWQEFLKNDPSAFVRACSEAQKAVDYIRGIEFEKKQALAA
jgi:antirestriction protein ArdC